jgi:type IV secretory pathway VirB10-like protein
VTGRCSQAEERPRPQISIKEMKMPSEFDLLVADINLQDAIEDLTPRQAVSFAKSLTDNVYSLRPDERRAIEGALAKAKAPQPLMAKAMPAARMPKAPPPVPVDFRKMTAEFERLGAMARDQHRTMTRDRTREAARGVLAKALELVHQGRLTAHEAASIEARAHRLMAAAAMEAGQ